MTESVTTMWGIKVRGRHKVFCAFEKSNHALEKCKQLKALGIVCKIVKLKVQEVCDARH